MDSIFIKNEYGNIKDFVPDYEQISSQVIVKACDILDYDLEGKEVSILVCDDKTIRKLNKEYRKQDKATNVLSFETGDEEMLGDIIISVPTVIKEAEELDIDFDKHFQHLVLHGFLHLLGYDHIEEEDAVVMETLEEKVLKNL